MQQPHIKRLYGQPAHADWLFVSMLPAIVIAALAVYRVAFMAAREEGPWDLFDRMRLAAARLPKQVVGNQTRAHWIQRGLGCPLCISWWLSLPAALCVSWWLAVPLWATLALWPAIAGLCLFLYQLGGT